MAANLVENDISVLVSEFVYLVGTFVIVLPLFEPKICKKMSLFTVFSLYKI